MKTLFRHFFCPILSIFSILLTAGYFTSFISIRLGLDGVSEYWIGITQGSYYVGLLLAALYLEKLIFRCGHKNAFYIFSIVFGAVIFTHSLFVDPFFWSLLRFFSGVSVACLFLVIESWFVVDSVESNRGVALALYMTIAYLAQGLGQYLLDFLPTLSLYPYFIASLICFIAPLPLYFAKNPSLPEKKPNSFGFTQLFLKSPFGFTSCFSGGLLQGALYAFLPIYASDNGFSPALVVSMSLFGGLMFQWPMGYLSDKFNRKNVLLLMIFFSIAPALYTLAFEFSIFAVFVIGGAVFTLYPHGVTQVCESVKKEDIVKVTSRLIFVYGLGGALGPTICSIPIEWTTSTAFFGFIAVAFSLQLCIPQLFKAFISTTQEPV